MSLDTDKDVTSVDTSSDVNNSSLENHSPADESSPAPESNSVGDKKNAVPSPAEEKKLRKTAKKTLAEAKSLFKRAKKSLAEDRINEVNKAIENLENALKNPDVSCSESHDQLVKVINSRLKFARKSSAQEIFESLLIAIAVAFVLRTFFIEPFKIPTRSMVPTLLEGDQLFVTKLSYGIRLPFADKYIVNFSDPQRGDVVVFAFPREDAAKYLAKTNSGCLGAENLSDQKDYIKRIIAVEGDTVEVRDQIVYVNGEPISQQAFYERTVKDYMFIADNRRESWNYEIHGDHKYTTITHELPVSQFGPITVDPGHVFVMGDNRDNSADSRCWGQVPVGNIKGRAQIIWYSSGTRGIRSERLFSKID